MGQIVDEKGHGIIEQQKGSGSVLSVVPKNLSISGEGKIYLETRTINVGEPMGLLLSLTYPNTFSYIAERF